MQTCECTLPSLPGLFDPAVPDNPVLWAVLNGRHTGHALVDDELVPSQCVLRTDTGLTFSSINVDPDFLHSAIACFRLTGAVWLLGYSISDSGSIVPYPDRISQRLELFDYDPCDPRLAELRARLPDGFEIRLIDRALLKRCEWQSEMEFFCGSTDNFLTNALGLCLMRAEEIITEAYVSSFGDAYAEIGAITHQAQRGKGYAPITCAYLIQECERRGFHGYWSCEMDNLASVRVARKLGFRREHTYEVLEYDRLQ